MRQLVLFFLLLSSCLGQYEVPDFDSIWSADYDDDADSSKKVEDERPSTTAPVTKKGKLDKK